MRHWLLSTVVVSWLHLKFSTRTRKVHHSDVYLHLYDPLRRLFAGIKDEIKMVLQLIFSQFHLIITSFGIWPLCHVHVIASFVGQRATAFVPAVKRNALTVVFVPESHWWMSERNSHVSKRFHERCWNFCSQFLLDRWLVGWTLTTDTDISQNELLPLV